MTCAEASTLLDAFVDAELSGAALLDVARHAAVCTACDTALRERSALHDAVERTMVAEAEQLDLSSVWPAVTARVARADARRAWRRRLRAAPAWGAVAALAAGMVLWVRSPAPEPERTAAVVRARPNHAVIERLNSGGQVDVRRERKNGTTLIMVSATDSGALR